MRRASLMIACLVLFTLICTGLVLADEATTEERVVPEVRANRINPQPPDIDGDLDDEAWKSAKVEFARGFTQHDPDEGSAATESTLVAVLYDDDAVYFGFWCYDSEPDKIVRKLVRRDRESESDQLEVRVDPYHDHRTGRGFNVSAAGVQQDYRIYNDGWTDQSWDGVWEGATKEQPWGWTAEMRIPYHCLRFAAKDEHVWGVDFVRYVCRKNEEVHWAYVPTSESGLTSNFGHLTGLREITPARHVEVLPYVVSSAETTPKSIGNPDGRDLVSNTGFDFKYGLSSSLVLDAAINPDFGQVELDQPVLNLSSYETYFSERRPFFVEGANLFETDFGLFYSRRIGRSPQRDVDDPEFDYYRSYPRSTTILGAAKVTGKLAGRTSIALLTSVTQREKAEYAAVTNLAIDTMLVGEELHMDTLSADTVLRKGVVEPEAGYTVLRVKQDVFENSSVGGMITMANQDGTRPATSGGVDWRLFAFNGGWLVRGQAILSRGDGSETGYGFNAAIEKVSGEHIRGSVGTTIKDPKLDVNRLGYTARANTRRVWGWMQYRTKKDWWIVRNSYNNVNAWSSWNYDGINYELGGNFNNWIDFTNNWGLGTTFSVQAEKYSDRETRGNGVWVWPEYPTFAGYFDLETDNRKAVSFHVAPSMGTDRGGTWWSNHFCTHYRPRSNLEFGLGATYHRTNNGTIWVTNVGDRSLFGDLDKDQISLSASAGVVLNRNLTLQLSAVGLIAGLDYGNYRYYEGDNEYSDPVAGVDADYNYSALNSTMLIRWEYHPGSTLYLVWTRARSEVAGDVNDLDFSRDFERFFSRGSENLFLVKTSYWLNI